MDRSGAGSQGPGWGSTSLAELTAYVKALEAPRLRVVVATDWSTVTVPLALLTSFGAMIPPDAPVDLVVAVPREPTEADAAGLEVVTGGLSPSVRPAVKLESFDEAARQPCVVAVVPDGDPDSLLLDLTRALLSLHRLAVVVADPALLAAERASAVVEPGLAARFVSYREPHPPPG